MRNGGAAAVGAAAAACGGRVQPHGPRRDRCAHPHVLHCASARAGAAGGPRQPPSPSQPSAATAAAAVRGAMLVFQDAGARGDLAPAAPAGDGEGEEAEAAYRAWLAARAADHAAATRRLLTRAGRFPAAQAAAARAALEAARSGEAGACDTGGLAAAVDALLAADLAPASGATPEAVAAFLAQTAAADVRYAALRGVAAAGERVRRAAERGGLPAAAAGARAGASTSESESDPDSDAGGLAARVADAGRTLSDFLLALPAETPSADASWCGASDMGGAAASVGADGSRARRKRRRDGAAGAAPSTPSSAPPAAWASLSRQRAAASSAWAAALRAPLPPDAARRLLAALPAWLPHIAHPVRLCDALADAVAAGGATALAALGALIELVLRHGLEHPRAYASLYSLTALPSLTGPDRARFAGLADAFLASPAVPAYVAAAFAKRFARLALAAPPPAAVACLAFVHNVLRRHRGCGGLLHREAARAGDEGADADASAAADPYDAATADPAASGAVASSLWEVAHLARSAHAAVAAAASALLASDPAARKGGELDYAVAVAGTYGTAVAAGAARRVKRPPAVTAPAGRAAPLWGGAAGGAFAAWA